MFCLNLFRLLLLTAEAGIAPNPQEDGRIHQTQVESGPSGIRQFQKDCHSQLPGRSQSPGRAKGTKGAKGKGGKDGKDGKGGKGGKGAARSSLAIRWCDLTMTIVVLSVCPCLSVLFLFLLCLHIILRMFSYYYYFFKYIFVPIM